MLSLAGDRSKSNESGEHKKEGIKKRQKNALLPLGIKILKDQSISPSLPSVPLQKARLNKGGWCPQDGRRNPYQKE